MASQRTPTTFSESGSIRASVTPRTISRTFGKAASVLAFEVGIARAFAPDSDAADTFKQNNPWKRADFDQKAPGLDWNAYFQAAGLSAQQNFIVWKPSDVIGVSALVRAEGLD